ncbi:methyl-accepting chemotaxis protein [Sagittula marina]|uniref:Methyl-accepting chemotaxis protein n=1 Tax=Sagittula marina TaxID=943940 RepID=A0A7W6DV57_9RHOB|nr:methyl-accepting chemotaxis protein [Sagittula marina]MBB3985829.1 methyl-accepting chemotaxis protein [Sagittula marina]
MTAAHPKQQEHHLGGAHAALSDDVLRLRDATEDVFLSTGEQLLEVSDLLSAALAAVDSLAALGREDVMDRLREQACTQPETFADLSTGFHEIFGRIKGLNDMILTLDKEVSSVRRSVMTTRFVMVNARVVLSSMLIQEQRLSSLTDDGSRIVGQMQQLLHQFEGAIRGIRASVTQVEHMIGEVGATVNGVVCTAFGALIADVSEFERNVRAIAGASDEMARQVQAIQSATAQAVEGLQVGDATRQRLEHVANILETMTGDGGLLPPMAATLLTDAAREQSGSLARLESNIAVLTDSLQTLVDKHLADFAGTTDHALDADTLLDGSARIAQTLETVRPMQERTRELDRMLHEELDQFNALTHEGEEVQFNIKQIGMNAVLACARLGDDGTPLKVVAEQIQFVAQDTSDSFARIRETMLRIGTLGRQITTESEEIITRSIQVPTTLSMRINPLIERVVHDLSPLQTVIGKIRGRVARLEFDFAPARAHTERLGDLAARLPRGTGSGDPQSHDVLAQIYACFTIEAEREIFSHFYPDDAANFRAGQHQAEETAGDVPDDDFFF